MTNFVRAALIRAIRTVAQTAVAAIGTTAMLSEVDWIAVVSTSVLAGLLSRLTSVATEATSCGISATISTMRKTDTLMMARMQERTRDCRSDRMREKI